MTDDLLVRPGKAAKLAERATDSRLGLTDKRAGEAESAALGIRLGELQDRLWAEQRQSLLVVVQAMDAGGKDGLVEHIFRGLNPSGVKVTSFKAPEAHELARDYLWRVHAHAPADGSIAIFNRSHYEDVVVVRVRHLVPTAVWKRRFRHIREFERLLAEEGTTIVKLFLHISAEEQAVRLQARVDDPDKQWKVQPSDLDDRRRWTEFVAAYEDAITETSTDRAPWYVLPSDRKWVRNVAASRVLVSVLEGMNPTYPEAAVDMGAVVIPAAG